ncbi:hypothetical protein UFOVP749_41 [uncultured Caudovirales phage]|uniref:Ead/Ea22-like family protein n=1 Tax=uncultured Caudovirales phage TaxID=2100421 RepID=A0A6J7X7N4_9CAUD|nr:hypothetical protein UFOVP749_41 [uncultured Caudovirales phage]
MTDDLIERLHSCEYVAYYDGEPGIVADEKLLHEAADRIETQANTIEELRSANERWVIAFKQAQDDAYGRIKALQADNARLLRANHVLRLGLSGMVDSEDALEIADAMARGDAIDWDQYPEATRKALVKPRVLFASLHNRVLTDAEIDQIIKERGDA